MRQDSGLQPSLYFSVTYLWYLVALVVCGLCVWKGDQPLRWAGGVVILSWASTPLFSHWDTHGVNVPVSVIDTNTTLAIIWISARWRTLWSVVLAAFSVLTVLNPFVAMADPSIRRNSWFGVNNVLAICDLITLLVALGLTLRARRRADEGAAPS